MNNLPRTWLTAAALAATLSAQAPTPQQALARAQLIETQEHDAAAAEQAYRTLLSDPIAVEVSGVAAMRLGALLWRLDRREEATTFLQTAISLADDYGGDRAAADQARSILQGQGEDAKLAQERLTKARALVGLYAQLRATPKDAAEGNDTYERSGKVLDELRPLGAQAAEAIAEFLEVGLRTGRIAKYPGDDPVRARLMYMLWEIGTEPAAIALRRWSEPEDLNVRLGAAEGCENAKVAADLEPVLLAYVRDPDPSGEVWRLVVNAVVRLPHDRHVELLAAEDAATRAAGLHALAATWKELSREQRQLFVERHAAAVRRATRDADTRVVSNAWHVLRRFGGGPTSATLVFFAEADRYPREMGHVSLDFPVEADDAWLHALTDAAQRVGRCSDDPANYALLNLVQRAAQKWTRASVDDVITLLDLGYGPPKRSNWALPALLLANEQQLARLIAMLPRAGNEAWIQQLGQRPLPASSFPGMRTVLEGCFAGEPMPWNTAPDPTTRTVRGRQIQVALPNTNTANLMWWAARTGSAEAATWLGDLVDRYPELATLCARALTMMSSGEAGTAAQAALRKLLVWEGTDQNELQPEERSLVFAELARAADVAAIPLFPRAYELGLSRVHAYREPGSRPNSPESCRAAGIGFLGDVYVGPRDDFKPWHAYSAADLVTAWRTLLDSPMLVRVLGDFTSRIDPTTGSAVEGRGVNISLVIPLAVLPALVERLPKMWAAAADAGVHDDLENRVGSAFNRVTIADVKPDRALRNALAALFRDENPKLAVLYRSLPPDVAREFAAEGRALLRRSSGPEILGSLERAGVELGEEDWSDALKSDSVEMRKEALRTMPKERGQRLRAAVEEQLMHQDSEVRICAAYAVRRLYGRDSVATLLPLLQDQATNVREYVRKSLDELRQDAEQRAFWAQAGSGIDTSPRGAAAKLLAQAKAGEPKDQRVLAIRSLAVLGAAESLPT